MKSYEFGKKTRLLLHKILNKWSCYFCYLRGYFYFGEKVYVEKNISIRGLQNIVIGKNCRIYKGAILHAISGRIVFKDDVTICANSIINPSGGEVVIDKGSTIGDFCNIYGQGGLYIGNDVMVASCVQIVPNQHIYQDISISIKYQKEKNKGIKIGNGSWIGTNVVILDGSQLGENVVIGAGSVVNKSIPDYSVAIGVPAQILKQYDTINNRWHQMIKQ